MITADLVFDFTNVSLPRGAVLPTYRGRTAPARKPSIPRYTHENNSVPSLHKPGILKI